MNAVLHASAALRPRTYRRGACPGLSAPMATGDGLLARLTPIGTIGLDAFAGLCAAARRHGNGAIEITARGSIQIRGLSANSSGPFAENIAPLDIAADGVPMIADPLAGLDPHEVIDTSMVAADLRRALAPLADKLSPKVSVAVDGGGVLHLDALAADIRLRAGLWSGARCFHLAVGGDAATAQPVGAVDAAQAIDATTTLLDVVAAQGHEARARDIVVHNGVGIFRAAIADRLIDVSMPAPRAAAEPIGTHALRDGRVAVGVGFAFGHTDAEILQRLLDAAKEAGAAGLRTAPGRALLVIGLVPERAARLAAAALDLGFIVDARDPRRRVVACAGAPICAAGEIPARALAPLATRAAALLNPTDVIHVSGCAKGCAHPRSAAMTAIGRAGQCDLLVDGVPAGSVTVGALPQRLHELAQQRPRSR
jgi:precorrin-3B synthase